MCAVWWCVVLCGVLCIAVLCAVCVGCSVVSSVCGAVRGVNVLLSQHLERSKQPAGMQKTRKGPAEILGEKRGLLIASLAL